MCGIVGAIAERNVSDILLEGLKRLEYRGYDSAGIALLNSNSEKLSDLKTVGKVEKVRPKRSGAISAVTARKDRSGSASQLQTMASVAKPAMK